MKSTLIVVLLTFLRLGVPAFIMLSLGEAFRLRHHETKSTAGGIA